MIVLMFIYIAAIAGIVLIVGFLKKSRRRNIAMAMLVTAIGLPVVIGFGLYFLKTPIQQGKLLKGTMIGPLLNLVAPPEDLYLPLVEARLETAKSEYQFQFAHKYVGNHALVVSSPQPQKEAYPRYDDIAIKLTVLEDEPAIFTIENKRFGKFTGRNAYGAVVARYRVPEDLPVSTRLNAKVWIDGDLEGFLGRRGPTVIKIKKISDQ